MKTAITTVMMLALTVAFGCMSPSGGGMAKDEGFKIQVPMLATEIKQGDRQTINVSLHRAEFFKQDVKVESRASQGLTVTPASALVKASGSPELALQIAVPKDAALGEYRVYVKGTPETGQPTSIEIKVKVVAP